MTHRRSPWLLLAVLAASGTLAAPREPERLVVAGSEPAPIHVAAGRTTVLAFDAPPLREGTRVEGAAVPLLVTEQGVVLFPSKELESRESAILSVALADGARVRLALVSLPEDVDVRVRILRSAPPEGAAELRVRLERCERERSGVDATARYLLEHGDVGGLFAVHEAEATVKSTAPGVGAIATVADRASGVSYVLLSVQPEEPFAVARVRLTGEDGGELPVLRVLPQPLAFPAGGPSWLVIAFVPPPGGGALVAHLHGSDGAVLDVPVKDAPPGR